MARRMQTIPTETVGFEPTERTSGKQKQSRIVPGSYLWPELRVSRAAAWKANENWELGDFLLDSGAHNRRRGTTHVLSAVACTYLKDTEFRGMLLQKYPKIDGDMRAARAVYRGVARTINSHIRSSTQRVQGFHRANHDRERFFQETDGDGPLELSQIWQKGVFRVNGQRGYGKNHIGLVLKSNDELWEERREVIDFLRTQEKLDTDRFVDRDWEPHAVTFDVRPELRLARVVMEYTEPTPPSIILSVPSAQTDV